MVLFHLFFIFSRSSDQKLWSSLLYFFYLQLLRYLLKENVLTFCLHKVLIKCRLSVKKSSLWFYIDDVLWKKVSTLLHFLKMYFLFFFNVGEIQQKIKFMSSKTSNVVHPQNTVFKAIKVLQHFKNYVPTCVKSAKKIFSSILVALNPKWAPAYYKTRNTGTRNSRTRNANGTAEHPGTVAEQRNTPEH